MSVSVAIFAEGCLRASGCVTEMKRSHVTRDRIRTDDSHESVLKKPKNKKENCCRRVGDGYDDTVLLPHRLHSGLCLQRNSCNK